jgi:hypothetical protein
MYAYMELRMAPGVTMHKPQQLAATISVHDADDQIQLNRLSRRTQVQPAMACKSGRKF